MPGGQGFRTRGYLPHIELPGATQFVTFRLADSLPPNALERLSIELAKLPESEQARERMRRVESLLDAGHGSQLLKNPIAANVVTDSIVFAATNWCAVHAFVVMPTHVHLLATFPGGLAVSEVVRRVKSYTAKEIQRRLPVPNGRFWQPDFFDKVVSCGEKMGRTIDYIEWNPVKAGLCADPKKWPYSSANDFALKRLVEATAGRAGGPTG